MMRTLGRSPAGDANAEVLPIATLRRVETWVDWLLALIERRKEHRQLLEMPDHLLKDIGVTRADVLRAASRWR
jgi:uncharacterized protein YjiS (DUF1127 family)